MPVFKLNMVDAKDQPVVLHYNNENNVIYHADGVTPITLPHPRLMNIDVPFYGKKEAIAYNTTDTPVRRNTNGEFSDIRIFLGAKCNFRCTYCYQDDVREFEPSFNLRKVPAFLEQMEKWYNGGKDKKGMGTRMQFWGGEPFVYWKVLKEMILGVRQRWPNMHMGMVTNGSLLNEEIADFLMEHQIGISISHDGPGQHYRGPDPLEDIVARNAINRLYNAGMVMFNPTLHVKNYSKKQILDFFKERFGDVRGIGEGDFIEIFNPTSEVQMELTINDSRTAHLVARNTANELLTHPEISQKYSIVQTRLKSFFQCIFQQVPIDAIQDPCGTTNPNRMVVDCDGNMLLCHHGNREGAVNSCGSHTHVSDIANNAIYSAVHWSHKPHCRNCPVITICRGACPFTTDLSHTVNCNSGFYDTVSIFAYGLFLLTGLRLDSIEGPHTKVFPDRCDIFGFRDTDENNIVYNEQPKKKIIPIKAV